MLERVVYFDTELLALFAREELGIPRESMLERDELDLAFGMTLLLEPFRTFTKFVQHRSKVTLGEAASLMLLWNSSLPVDSLLYSLHDLYTLSPEWKSSKRFSLPRFGTDLGPFSLGNLSHWLLLTCCPVETDSPSATFLLSKARWMQ